MPNDWLPGIEIGLIAFAAGTFGAMVGLGGGLLLIPSLITIFSIDEYSARFAGLAAVCATSLSGSLVYIRQGVTDMSAAGLLQLPATIGAVIGARIGENAHPNVMRVVFSIVLIYTAWRLIANSPTASAAEPAKSRMMFAWSACCLGGMLSAFLGVGGGVVFAPVLTLVMNLPARAAAATSTYLISLTAAGSALLFYRHLRAEAIPSVVMPAVIGILLGAQLGAVLSGKVDAKVLKRVLSVGVILAAASLIWKAASHG